MRGTDAIDKLSTYLSTIFGTAMFWDGYHSSKSLSMHLVDLYQLLRHRVCTEVYILSANKDTIKINIAALTKQCGQTKTL